MSSRPLGTDLPGPLLRARRGRVIRAGAIAIGLLTAVALLFGTILVAQLLGSRSWRAEDPISAGQHFAVNHRLNVVERWIAPFNLGVAAHGRGRWLEAAEYYGEADPLAPEDARCRILLNWSWALESAGDEAQRTGHSDQAMDHWRAAKAVVARARGCDDGRDDGSSGQNDQDPDQPSTSPTPSSAPPPSATPSAQASEPGKDDQQAPGSGEDDPSDTGSGDDQPAEPKPGSEQDQVEQTRKRIKQKVGIPSDGKPQDQSGTESERSDRLNERNQQAVEQRQRMQDDERRSSDDSPVRSW